MISSFCGLHEAGSKSAVLGPGLCGGTVFELAEALFECRRFVPLEIFVTSLTGLAPGFVGSSDLCLVADAIQLSSDIGLRTDLEGSL